MVAFPRRAAPAEKAATPPPDPATWARPVRGAGTEVLVVCEPQNEYAVGLEMPMDGHQLALFGRMCDGLGLEKELFVFVGLCPPVPKQDQGSAARTWKHVEAYLPGLLEEIAARRPRLVVVLGALAARAVFGRPTRITKCRGVPVQHAALPCPILPMLSPGYVLRTPEHEPTFQADVGLLARLRATHWDHSGLGLGRPRYEYVFDLGPLRREVAGVVAIDTETTALRYWAADAAVITVQVTPRPGVSWICPIHAGWVAREFPEVPAGQLRILRQQLAALLADPRVRKIGHNIKFDDQMLAREGFSVRGWLHDTLQMAWCVDEDMLSKSLADCVRRWVPEMAGYSDLFDLHADKSDMLAVPKDDILGPDGEVAVHGLRDYAGGDTDACFRLARALDPLLRREPGQREIYKRIQVPALLAFSRAMEPYGPVVDQERLRAFGAEVRDFVSRKYIELIRQVPVPVRRSHAALGMEFTRRNFVKDILFSADGFGLDPVLWTKSTEDLPEDERAPQTGKKQLAYFVTHHDPAVRRFAAGLVEYDQAQKLLTTYIGDEGKGTGFWKYIAPDGRVRPSYALHVTNTGRTASRDPNGQNFPKRGRWAKPYRDVFLSTEGHLFGACDLSQIELRLVAIEAEEPTMLQVYRDGGDIHAETARTLNGLTPGQWAALGEERIDELRRGAKAANFGLIYGMSAHGFRVYAKTEYGIDLSFEEAEAWRDAFFKKYAALAAWHERRKREARKHGRVVTLTGGVRHLSGIRSNDSGMRSLAERQAINAPIQRLGSELGCTALVRMAAQAGAPFPIHFVAFIHDQLIIEAPEEHIDEATGWLRWAMESAPVDRWFGLCFPVPILADAEVAADRRLSSLRKRKDIAATKPAWWDDDEDARIRRFAYG